MFENDNSSAFFFYTGKWTIFIEIPGSLGIEKGLMKFEVVLCNMNILCSYIKLSFIKVNFSQY